MSYLPVMQQYLHEKTAGDVNWLPFHQVPHGTMTSSLKQVQWNLDNFEETRPSEQKTFKSVLAPTMAASKTGGGTGFVCVCSLFEQEYNACDAFNDRIKHIGTNPRTSGTVASTTIHSGYPMANRGAKNVQTNSSTLSNRGRW